MKLAIRRYHPSDRDAIWNLNSLSLEALGKRPQGPIVERLDRELRDIEGAYLSDGGEFLVGLVERRVVAMGALKKLSSTDAEISKMRVHPDFWRRGYGQAILDRLQGRAVELGFRRLWLDTSPKQTAAQQLYLKNGYREFQTCTLADSGVQLIIFEKELSEERQGAP
jgi:GNAT superfamily N-acetyltransferase